MLRLHHADSATENQDRNLKNNVTTFECIQKLTAT